MRPGELSEAIKTRAPPTKPGVDNYCLLLKKSDPELLSVA
jgi:hypothetical protein